MNRAWEGMSFGMLWNLKNCPVIYDAIHPIRWNVARSVSYYSRQPECAGINLIQAQNRVREFLMLMLIRNEHSLVVLSKLAAKMRENTLDAFEGLMMIFENQPQLKSQVQRIIDFYNLIKMGTAHKILFTGALIGSLSDLVCDYPRCLDQPEHLQWMLRSAMVQDDVLLLDELAEQLKRKHLSRRMRLITK